MIVDCHVHTQRYPDHFIRDIMVRNQPPRRQNWTDEQFKRMWDLPVEVYLKEAEGVVDKGILMGLRAENTQGAFIPNDYLEGLARKYPDKLAWCCRVVPTEKGAAKEVERCVKEGGAVGVGELGPIYASYRANDPRCFPVYEKAQELGVPIVIHAGPGAGKSVRLSYGNVLDIDDVALEFPELKIVIAHVGYYKYEDAIFLIQKHENVFGDISALVRNAGLDRTILPRFLPVIEYPYFHLLHPLLYYFSQHFGATDKLLWGTDFNATYPKKSVEILLNVNTLLRKYNLPEIPQQSINNILHENWKKVFKL